MDERTVIVTGGNAGLGYETAKNIALTDPAYHVVLACRSRSRGAEAAESLRTETGNRNIQAMQMDLASLESVRAFATSFSAEGRPPLYGIVCNAGISAAGVAGSPKTVDGFEMIFGVNHLAHFLLTNLLLPAVEDGGRIVFVTSDLHNPPVLFPAKARYVSGDAIAHGKAGMAQYCASKLCNIYCTYELARLIPTNTTKRITVNAFNPGALSDTGFSAPTGNAITRGAVRIIGGIMGALIGKQSTAAASGSTLASLITSPEFARITGAYLDRGVPAESSLLSHDQRNAEELWRSSATMSGLRPEEAILDTGYAA
jgi:NAD(P)-dependent dehydrogenase (short-subunit alcohol dehydrogenase family)